MARAAATQTDFGGYLRKLATANGYSQASLAQAAGINGPEASLTMDDIPGRDWDAIIALTSAFLEQARRRRSWHEARNERDGALTAAVATVMGPQPGGGWISGSCRTAG